MTTTEDTAELLCQELAVSEADILNGGVRIFV